MCLLYHRLCICSLYNLWVSGAQEKPPCSIGIYILEESSELEDRAHTIKCVLESQCQINHYLPLQQRISAFKKASLAGITAQSKSQYWQRFLSFKVLQVCRFLRLIEYCTEFDKLRDGRNVTVMSITCLKQLTDSSHDVVILLGHSTICNFGLFSTSDILGILCHSQTQPSIIAFLGCCSGSNRHGPFVMVPHQWKTKTVFGFYQRRVCIDELEKTSIVLGIRNYLHLSTVHRDLEPRIIAKHAFVLASLDVPTCDPTVFANDSDEAVTLQSFLQALEIREVEDIPLSCKHLAVLHSFANENSIKLKCFLQEVKQLKSIQEIDDKCKDEFKRLNLDKLIPKIVHLIYTTQSKVENKVSCELKFCLSTSETHLEIEFHLSMLQEHWLYDIMQNIETINDLNDMDDFELFLAILQGKWGKHSYLDIKNHAYSQLDRLKQQKKHQIYELCAALFFLSFEDSYLNLDSTGQICDTFCQNLQPFDNKRLEKHIYENQVNLPKNSPTSHNWVILYHGHCQERPEFCDEINQNGHHSIINYLNHDNLQSYHYERKDFTKAMKALQDYLFMVYPLKTSQIEHVKIEFEQSQGYSKVLFKELLKNASCSSEKSSAILPFKLSQQISLHIFEKLILFSTKILQESGREQENLSSYMKLQSYLCEFKKLQESDVEFMSQEVAIALNLFEESQKKALELLENSRTCVLKQFKESESYVCTYNVKKFHNDNKCGHMKCFPFIEPFLFAELRIIPEQKDSPGQRTATNPNKNPSSVFRCRFVYAYIKKQNKYKGKLFMTTSHYGWDMLPETMLNEILTRLQQSVCDKTWKEKCEIATQKLRMYHLQQEVVRHCVSAQDDNSWEFPFVYLGKWIIHNNHIVKVT